MSGNQGQQSRSRSRAEARNGGRPIRKRERAAKTAGNGHGSLSETPRAVQEDRGAVLEQRLLRAVIDKIPICLWAINREGTFTYHDGLGLQVAGLRPSQHVGENIFDLYPEDKGVRRALAGEPMRTSGEAYGVHWDSWLIPEKNAEGEITGLIGFTLDVTETRRAEQELRVQLDRVEKQQQVIRELSTPIIEVWDGVLTLPMVGVLDTVRTADVMESLLGRITETSAQFAILDLTGVEVVDTKVASHLISLVNAIRLLGAEGLITGIKPTVAQTMVALGLDLTTIVTRANLKAGLKYCIQRANAARAGGAAAPPCSRSA